MPHAARSGAGNCRGVTSAVAATATFGMLFRPPALIV
jgi:hypothetical protein